MRIARDKDGSLRLYEKNPIGKGINGRLMSPNSKMKRIDEAGFLKYREDEPTELVKIKKYANTENSSNS